MSSCLQELAKLNKPFKYVPWQQKEAFYCGCPKAVAWRFFVQVVTCIIMQKSGAPLHTSIALHWDTKTDGTSCVQVGTDTMDSWQGS